MGYIASGASPAHPKYRQDVKLLSLTFYSLVSIVVAKSHMNYQLGGEQDFKIYPTGVEFQWQCQWCS